MNPEGGERQLELSPPRSGAIQPPVLNIPPPLLPLSNLPLQAPHHQTLLVLLQPPDLLPDLPLPLPPLGPGLSFDSICPNIYLESLVAQPKYSLNIEKIFTPKALKTVQNALSIRHKQYSTYLPFIVSQH